MKIKHNLIFKTFLILSLMLMIGIVVLSQGKIYGRKELVYGLTFSKKKAADLGFEWRTVYLAMLDELGVKRLRLSAYWDEVESGEGIYNFNDVDWQVAEAEKRGASIILALGGRLPRWPECHFPEWSKNYPKSQREERILEYIKNSIERYRDNPAIGAWQIENEPFLGHFGDCPELDPHFLDQEIGLARSLDSRPIVITDSGELSLWIPAAKRADIFGTTMYRDTYSSHLKSYIHYPLSPNFFQFKRNFTRLFADPKEMVVIELQAEPWGPQPYETLTKADRERTMSMQKFREILDYAQMTGFQKFYLWGVEWWYWEKERNNNPEMWNEAKQIFGKGL
jgi:hypothetical protein